MTSRMSKKTTAPTIHATQPMSNPVDATAPVAEASRALAGTASRAPVRVRDPQISIGADEPADSLSFKANGASVQICAMIMLFLLFCAVLLSTHALHPSSEVSQGLSILLQP